MPEIIRTSKHSLKDCNTKKIQSLSVFLEEYSYALKEYVHFLCNNEIHYKKKDIDVLFSLKKNLLDCPSVLDYKIIKFETKLSARALSSAMTQACGVVKGIANNIKELQNKIEYLKKSGYSTKRTELLLEKALNAKEPELKHLKAELSTKCANFIDVDNSFFDGFLKLSALGVCESIVIPVKYTKHSNNLVQKGYERMSSFLISSDTIEIRWKKKVEKKQNGKTVGCDTGIKDIASFSEDDVLDHDSGYDNILNKISRKRRNSKSYKRSLIERDNYIRFILNKCNLDNIKQLNIENNSTLKFGKRSSRKLGSHAYGVIKDKLERICEEHGVLVIFTPSTYRSQRCSACGWTHRSNRKDKIFSCKLCHYSDDADKNSSRNQLVTLPYITSNIRNLKLNRSGFLWNPSGIYDKMGRSLESLLQSKQENLISI